jgi:hypothetical protein
VRQSRVSIRAEKKPKRRASNRHKSPEPSPYGIPPRRPCDPIAFVLEVSPGGQRQSRIVAEVAAAEIAGAAEQAAHLAGLVVVVDAEVALDLALADAAAAVLPREDRVVFLDGDTVVIFEVVLALALGAIFALFQLARRILVPLLAALGVDALLVGGVPGPFVGAGVLPVRFVFGIALPAARVVIGVGTHGMAIPGKRCAKAGDTNKSAFTRVFDAPQKARSRATAITAGAAGLGPGGLGGGPGPLSTDTLL